MNHTERIINRIFESNTYFISFGGSRDARIVDVGDSKNVVDIPNFQFRSSWCFPNPYAF